MFQTLAVYSDPKLQKGVLSFLRTACAQNETFVKALAASIVKRGPQKLSRQQALTLLQWSTIVIRNLDQNKAAKAIQKLIECQVCSQVHLARYPPCNRQSIRYMPDPRLFLCGFRPRPLSIIMDHIVTTRLPPIASSLAIGSSTD